MLRSLRSPSLALRLPFGAAERAGHREGSRTARALIGLVIVVVAVVAGFWAGSRQAPSLAVVTIIVGVAGLWLTVVRAPRRPGARELAVNLQEAIDALADGFVLYDADDRMVLANRKYRELHPVNPAATYLGVRFEDQFRAAIDCGEIPLFGRDRETVVRERLAHHRNPTGALEHQYGRGWIRISEHRTADGGTVGIHADITALKQAQAAAEAAEQLLRDAVDSVSAGFAIYDANDRLVMCNQHYRDLYPNSATLMVSGARFEDILRAGIASGRIPDAIGREEEWFAERLRRRRQGAFNQEEREMDGRWILVTERKTRDGGVAGLRIDITELKKAQAELEAARARMADFAEAATDWFWESDADGRMTYLSEPFEKTTGISVASRMGAARLDVNHRLDPDNPGWEAHVADLAERRPFRDFVMTVSFPTGVKHISMSGKPIFGVDGTFLGYRGTTRDVTREIEAQRTLARQKEELAVTAEKLQAASSAKSLFLANMSHELRTPLNAILGFSGIMRDAQIGPLDKRYQAYAADIHDAGEYLLRLINHVLDTAKMETGQIKLHEDAVVLSDVIAECRRLVQEKASAANVALVVDVPPDLPTLFADRLRLMQAILNVMSNAVKFTPPGGRVSVSVIGPGSEGMAVVVADTGIGMKASDIPVALEPFRQIDGSFVRRYEGTGLGLPLAKAFIELHGGRLDIDSAPDRGTTIRAWLPPHRVMVADRAQG